MSNTPKNRLTPISQHLKALRLTALVVSAFALSTQTGQTSANGALDKFMGGMYTNTTAGGYFSAQQRGVISGGSFVGRVPIKPINIASIDVPRVSAGCGGINLFGGSFSFINAKELTALLRAIAQNALGLLFQLGINAISQPLSSMITIWSRKLQEMNSTLKNSCEAARKLFSLDTSGEALAESFKQNATAIGASFGEFNDYFSGVSARFKAGWSSLQGKEPNTPEEQKTNADKAKEDRPEVNNLTWRGLNQSKVAAQILGFNANEDSTFEVNSLLMNLIGTEVYDINSKVGECKAGEGKCEPKRLIVEPSLEFDDLISPPSEKNTFAYCKPQDTSENGCTDLILDGKLSNFYKGIRVKLNRIFYGIDNRADVLQAEEILAAMHSADGGGLYGKSMLITPKLTDEEKLFIQNDPLSSSTHFTKFSSNPELGIGFSEAIRKITERRMAIALGESLLTSASGAFSGKEVTASKPQGFEANLQRFKSDLQANSIKPSLEITDSLSVAEYADKILNSLPSSGIPTKNN